MNHKISAFILACIFAVAIPAQAEKSPALKNSPKTGVFCTIQNSKRCQDTVTPNQVLAHLVAGNSRFVSGRNHRQNYLEEVKATAVAQFPLASVLSCIDSRAPAEIVFDQGLGNLFNARVAGNIVNEDILGSLEFAHKIAGAKLLIVMGHTSCGAIKGACDDAKMGNLTGLISKIRPALQMVSADVKDRSSKNTRFVDLVSEANVHMTVEAIRDKSPILREMEQKGEIEIRGAMYDVSTGKVKFYEMPAASKPEGASRKS